MQDIFDALNTDPENDIVARGAAELDALGVRASGVLLVHSAFRPAREQARTPENIIGAFVRALGERGTLLLPSLSFGHVTRENPYFDVELTPSNIGFLAEFFRLLPVTRRSVHPTHSVSAYGRHADEIVFQHIHDTTPVGPHSPFREVSKRNGQILMFGCGLRPNTSMHGVEELAGAPYIFGPESTTYIITTKGRTFEAVHKRHNFQRYVQRYDRVANLLEQPDLIHGTVFGADCWLIDARAMWNVCSQRIKDDTYYFVDKE